MLRTGRRAWPLVLTALALLSLALGTGCDSVEPMGGDEDPPTGTTVTNPEDGSALNSAVINVRGRAEVGAEVKVYVNDVLAGSAVSAPAVPYDGRQGRYTVEDVDLGLEGPKVLRVVATDLYGNVADQPVLIDIDLDMTPPPVAFESLNPAEDVVYNEIDERWETGVPRLRLVGRTDTLAAGARVRYNGINVFLPDSTYAYPAGAGEPDSLRFWIPMTAPTLTTANPDSQITYFVEAYDYAGNVSATDVDVYWNAEGKDTILTHKVVDEPISFQDYITGQAGMKVAVGYQAPVWANYIIGMRYFIGNDGETDPQNPQTPTTKPFTARVWRPLASDAWPGTQADVAKNSGSQYPEMEWLQLNLENPVDISNNDHYPNKQFFVGLEWDNRNNPPIGVDSSEGEVDFTSWRLPWYPPWELLDSADVMIEAIVSDIPAAIEGARVAVIRAGGETVYQVE